MKIKTKIIVSFIVLIGIIVGFSYLNLPANKIGTTSELIMLGDLNNDKKWDEKDSVELNKVLKNPFLVENLMSFKIDVNNNQSIDEEDLNFLNRLYDIHNPYEAEKSAKEQNEIFPRPREFFKYLPKDEYIQTPIYLIKNNILENSPLNFLKTLEFNHFTSPYKHQLINEIYNEAIRFSLAFEIRKNDLTDIEKTYVNRKILNCKNLFEQNNDYQLLLNLISLVEDAETLTTKTQPDFIKNILFFRDHLKELLISKDYQSFENEKMSYEKILNNIEFYLKADLNISIKLKTLTSPRDFKNLKNYVDRAQWQVYKSKTRIEDFKKLILYAQNDRRYLRAASKTSPKLKDVELKNHNLPMILLFREALKIKNNDKKAAVGLLDEAIRIPLGWVKSIPKNVLPSSVALENFLLPGNKEDGLDKSRHWNVFGGVAIYKSPKDSLLLALKRESMDLRETNYSKEAMREFIRDTISNVNGIYYVISMNPKLISN